MMRMEPHRSHSFGASVLKLIGHVAGGAVLFASLAGLSWLLGLGVAKLHAVHPFSESVLQLLHGVELGFLYLDVVLSVIVLLVGAFRFLKEIAGAHYG